jgi:drug/metabolite transporter (DMT)-like permease
VLGAALCYAASSLFVARRLAGAQPLVIALGSMVAATLVSLPAGVAQLPSEPPGWKAIASVVVLGVAGSAIAYLLYYGIILGAGASRAILVTYLVPFAALVYGAVFLGESMSASDLGGLALILAGVALGTGAVGARARRTASVRS